MSVADIDDVDAADDDDDDDDDELSCSEDNPTPPFVNPFVICCLIFNRESPSALASATASSFSFAHASGYLLWYEAASSPLNNFPSKGKDSPKSAIHPLTPVSPIMWCLMMSFIHLRAAGLVVSNMQNSIEPECK